MSGSIKPFSYIFFMFSNAGSAFFENTAGINLPSSLIHLKSLPLPSLVATGLPYNQKNPPSILVVVVVRPVICLPSGSDLTIASSIASNSSQVSGSFVIPAF
ncbi:hypothetical protein D3C71_1786940 [compost metagenome]